MARRSDYSSESARRLDSAIRSGEVDRVDHLLSAEKHSHESVKAAVRLAVQEEQWQVAELLSGHAAAGVAEGGAQKALSEMVKTVPFVVKFQLIAPRSGPGRRGYPRLSDFSARPGSIRIVRLSDVSRGGFCVQLGTPPSRERAKCQVDVIRAVAALTKGLSEACHAGLLAREVRGLVESAEPGVYEVVMSESSASPS